jgi:hypothetical protein
MDIFGCGRCQNVLERSFYGHFRSWQMSKCLRKELLWTFPVVVDVKMSKKGAFMDISGRGRSQNVLERSFYGHFRLW